MKKLTQLKRTAGTIILILLTSAFSAFSQVNVTASSTDVYCFGGSDGSITANATGGTPPYQYSIDGGVTFQASSVFTALAAGSYTILVMDAVSQTGSTTVSISQPAQIIISSSTVNPSCSGINDGQICANVTGGVPPYNYLWSNGSFLPCPNNLASGTYTVTVTDMNACTATTIATITSPPALVLGPLQDQTVCDSTLISVCPTPAGGTPPYNYQLEINGTPVAGFIPCNPMAVIAGTYVITVTDTNGCTVTDVFNVTTIPNPSFGIHTSLAPCNFPVQVCSPAVSGTAPFLYQWNTGSNTQCITVNTSGTYTVTVTDPNGCTASAAIPVNYSPGWQSIDLAINSLPACGQCNGSITPSVNGGAGGPLVYLWSDASTAPTNNGLCDNQDGYVIITDTSNCVDTAFFKLDCYSVWPGDANNDGVANNVDLLPIGIGYGTTGEPRSVAGIVWQGEVSLSWADTLVGGTNYKHIDCDGNGTIADDDTLAILQNFSLTHPRLTPRVQHLNDPPLYFDIVLDTVGTSQQLDVPLYFGTILDPADSIYGMAFTVNYDTSLVQANTVSIGFSPSWLGTVGTNLIHISKNDTQNGKLYVGVTRIDQSDISGFGEIARVTVVTTDNVSGRLSQMTVDTLSFNISDLTIINKDEINLNAFIIGDSLIIEDLTSVNELNGLQKSIQLFPNPSREKTFIRSSQSRILSVEITDVAGKIISPLTDENNTALMKRTSDYEFALNTGLLQPGLYLVKIITTRGNIVKSLTVVY